MELVIYTESGHLVFELAECGKIAIALVFRLHKERQHQTLWRSG
jgi:hypothetical protein